MVKTSTLSLSTRGNADCHDITGQLASAIAAGGLTSGTVTVFCPSSTSALTTIEFETGAIMDLRRLFDEVLPPSASMPTTRAGVMATAEHVRAAALGPS
jgi:thiamine phosphate synthase YjbQ (UPF0047 family)